jgi:acyl-CoA reductase-like NAD-dependent aldehyde dehydrogenase
MQPTQGEVKEHRYFAGGEWREAADNNVFEVHEPYSGKLFARVAAGSRADGRAAVDAAAKAFPSWAESTPAERARLFLKAAEIVKRRRTEIAEVLARETGSTISFATFQQRHPFRGLHECKRPETRNGSSLAGGARSSLRRFE